MIRMRDGIGEELRDGLMDRAWLGVTALFPGLGTTWMEAMKVACWYVVKCARALDFTREVLHLKVDEAWEGFERAEGDVIN